MLRGAARAQLKGHEGNSLMATHSEFVEQLVEVVQKDLALDGQAVEPSSRLIADLGLDSVAFAIALVAIEERFEVRVSEEELMACSTVDDVATIVERHCAAARPAGEVSA